MKNVPKYFLGGLIALISLIALYQAAQLIANFTQKFFPQFSIMLITLTIFFFVVAVIGYFIAKNRMLIYFIFNILLNLKDFSSKTKDAFDNPVYFEVHPGIQKIGFITNKDIMFMGDSLEENKKIAVYAPNPISFSGEMFIVERKALRIVEEKEKKNIPTLLFTAGILDELT